MKKGTIIGLLIFIILSGGSFMLLTNAHIEIFPGKEHKYDFFNKKENWEDKPVALISVFNPILGKDGVKSIEDNYSELTMSGYGMVLLVIVGIPFLLTYPFARRMNRRIAKKAAEKSSSI
jgi:hypothetical protein